MARPHPHPHLFVDISSHGFGHLAQAAPVLNALAGRLPTLRLTIRSGLSIENLRTRLTHDFTHIAAASDFGYLMHDAIRVDLAATAALYRSLHADWAARVADEAVFLAALEPDLVLSDVAYLPLAGAAQAGIPALALSSLNWADLFTHYFSAEPWAAPIHRQMLAAYNSAERFLRLTPGMPMTDLQRVQPLAPVAALGRDCGPSLHEQLGCTADERLVLIAFGGFSKRLPIESWPTVKGVHWLVHESWQLKHANATAFEPLGRPFTDLLHTVDAVITKPGYGLFSEAGCNGTPVLYVRREDWPEQDCLIDWLAVHGRCREISDADLLAGRLDAALAALWSQPSPLPPLPAGAEDAAAILLSRLLPV
jgi:hypothetical protein